MDQASDQVYLSDESAAEAFEAVLDRGNYAEPGHDEGKAEMRSPIPDEPDDVVQEEPEQEQEEEEQEAAPDPQRYRIRVNGEEEFVTLDELVNGYQRQKDYTIKTQSLAHQRKEAEQLLNSYSERVNQLNILAQQLQEQPVIPEPEIDWEKLYDSDPVEWVRQRELARDRQELRNQRQQQLAALAQEQQNLSVQRLQTHLAKEQENLLRLIPEWSDPELAKSEKTALREFAKEVYGLSDDDVSRAYDSRLVAMLRSAYLFHQGQQKATEAVKPRAEKAARTQGRSVRAPSEATRLKDANRRLAQSGSLEDAERVFEQMFG